MLTSAPRHLALVIFLTVCLILYFLIGTSQRLHTAQSIQEVGHRYVSHSPDHPGYASIPDSSPKLPDTASHDDHDHALNADWSPELPHDLAHDHDEHASVLDSSNELLHIATHDQPDHASDLYASPGFPDAPDHDHQDQASALTESPELSQFAHHHHSIVPTKAPVTPAPSAPSTADDKESTESILSANEPPENVDLASKEEEIPPATFAENSHKTSKTTDLEPEGGSIGSLPLGRPSKIHQVTLIPDGEGLEHDMYEQALKGHVAYGERFGYETHVLREDIVSAGENREDENGRRQAGVFRKPLDVLSLLTIELAKPVEGRPEWFAWIDADTIILNPNIPFDAFLPPTSDAIFETIHFVGSQDESGFNCGVFFIRVHQWSVDLLTDVSALPRLHPDMHLSPNQDQDALKYLLQQEDRLDNIIYEPQHWFNSDHLAREHDNEVTPGDLLVHFAGIYGEKRVEAMSEWFEKAEREKDTFTVPFEKTSMMDEVSDFWTRWKKAKTLLQEIELSLQNESTPTAHEAFQKLRNAIRKYPYDRKFLEQVMREAEMATGIEPPSEEKDAKLHSQDKNDTNVDETPEINPIIHKHNGVIIQEVEIPTTSQPEPTPIPETEKEHDRAAPSEPEALHDTEDAEPESSPDEAQPAWVRKY